MLPSSGAESTPVSYRSDRSQDGRETLALEVARQAVHEDLYSYAEMKPLMQRLLPRGTDAEHSPYALICRLLASGETEARILLPRVHAGIMKEAVNAAKALRGAPGYDWHSAPLLAHLPPDLPPGWRYDEALLEALRQAAQLERDRAFLGGTAPDLTGPVRAVGEACAHQAELLRGQPSRWSCFSAAELWAGFAPPAGTALPATAAVDARAEGDARLSELARLVVDSAAGPERTAALGRLVSWPDASAAAYLLQACVAPEVQAYTMHALALRSGVGYQNWSEWADWLRRAEEGSTRLRTAAARLAGEYRDELRLLWLRAQPGSPDPMLEEALQGAIAANARQHVDLAGFVRRWEIVITPFDIRRLAGGPVAVQAELGATPPPLSWAEPPPLPAGFVEQAVPPPIPTPSRPAAPERAVPVTVVRQPAPPPARPPAPPPIPPPPPAPTVWDEHLRPFLAANWYIIAGLLMVVAGASLLAYFTWDKSVLVRYLFLPVLLAGFTAGMAELGRRLFLQHEDLRASGAFLLGGAVCLLPVNFMVLCRAGEDTRSAGLLLPALALYGAMAGFGLWRWCGAVRPELRALLALPLLGVNLLAVLGDMPGVREAAAGHREMLVPATFTAAVLVLLAVSNRFLLLVLTRELLESKVVPWFFGITMVATTAQVAVWRHFHLGINPQPRDYALAVILIGATLLRWERRAGELRANGAAYGGESFLGYAALLLGILMAAGSEGLRIVALVLAGGIWLVQAPRRPGIVHYWIGATLCLLGGAAMGLLEAFPKSAELNLLPALGLALALLAGGARVLAGQYGEARLRQVALEIQPPILLLSSIVAVLSQYHLRSEPWQAGLVLAAAAVFFAVRGTRENRRDWLNIAAACAGLALPYLGCADMMLYRFGGNTLGLGFGLLAVAWLVAARLVPGSLWRESGALVSTWLGGAGILGLCLRLILAGGAELGWAELAGGALLAGALGVAAWQSRSVVPGLMAAGLLAVLLPLFAVPAGVWPDWLFVGTGLPSAAIALALMLGCFGLRRRSAGCAQAADSEAGNDCRAPLVVFITPALAAVGWLSAVALQRQLQTHGIQAPFILSSWLVAATFYAAAVYFRREAGGEILFHLSWPLLGAGFALVCDAAGCDGLEMLQYPLLWTGVALTALLAVEYEVARRMEWAGEFLLRPRLALLAYGSVIVAAFLALGIQVSGTDHRAELHWLALFVAAQLVWHGLRGAPRLYGTVLYVLVVSWLCYWRNLPVTPGALPLFLVGVLVADAVLEFWSQARAYLNPVRAPFVAGATVLTTILAAAGLVLYRPAAAGAIDFAWSRPELFLVIAAVLLVARAQACAGFALPAAVFGYLLCLLPCAADELFRPWRMAECALALCAAPFIGRALLTRWPRLLQGPTPQIPGAAATAQAPWFVLPGLFLAVGAGLGQVALAVGCGADDARWVQVFAPFAAVAAFALGGWYWSELVLWACAGCLLPLANLFGISVLWGRELAEAQLSPLHLGGIAAILTVAEFAAVRWWLVRADTRAAGAAVAAQWLHRGCVALAGFTLVLLGVNYLVDPDLEKIAAVRFLVSGLLALGAGVYFRFAARRPENLGTSAGVWLESLWHVALGLALWCGALSIPDLRTPQAALYTLALPAAACWCAAEWFLASAGSTEERRFTGARFRTSATAFAALILVFYVFRLPFQMLLFPSVPLGLDHYHTGAAAVVLIGLLLIRLRGLGGAPWAAMTGALALMVGLYFGVSWFPGLSPFDFPMAGAWTAVGLAHVFILLSFQQSPVRSLIQHIGGIGAEEWHAHRRQWGLFLTAAVHVAVVSGVVQDFGAHSLETTPLLAALASVLIHQALIGAPWVREYWGLAGLELFLALHLDFLLPASAPGLIPAKTVVWFLLAPWLGAVLGWGRLRGRVDLRAMGTVAAALGLVCAGHLLYHGPATGSGLVIFAAMLLAAVATPLCDEAPAARALAPVLPVAPLWLAYFGTRWLTGAEAAGFLPLLAGAAALVGSGLLARLTGGVVLPLTPRRLAHEFLEHCRRNEETVARWLLGAAFAGLGMLTLLHPAARNGALGGMLALAFVWGVSCVAWFLEGRLRDGVLPYVLSVLSLAGAWILLRRLLFLNFDFWTYEYDIWLSLGASVAFSAAKRLVKHERPGLGRTMTGTVWLLPVLQCVWLVSTRMGADLTLLVIGVQSMLFAWQGGGRRDSPYNAVAMLGFVGFICLLFWAKLDLRCVQAYTIPSGLGVLGLVWLFGQHLPRELRNAVRLVTVLTMLGSCGYYALLDASYPLGFHLTMIVLCLAVMALGPVLRVQLYLYLGFAGFATDLAALVVKQFRGFDRSIQMMGVGGGLLMFGVAVVGGAILYKTHRELIVARLAQVRARLGAWE
jgi:hypothetical protein